MALSSLPAPNFTIAQKTKKKKIGSVRLCQQETNHHFIHQQHFNGFSVAPELLLEKGNVGEKP